MWLNGYLFIAYVVNSFLNARIAGLALQPYNDALRGHHPGTGAVQSAVLIASEYTKQLLAIQRRTKLRMKLSQQT